MPPITPTFFIFANQKHQCGNAGVGVGVGVGVHDTDTGTGVHDTGTGTPVLQYVSRHVCVLVRTCVIVDCRDYR